MGTPTSPTVILQTCSTFLAFGISHAIAAPAAQTAVAVKAQGPSKVSMSSFKNEQFNDANDDQFLRMLWAYLLHTFIEQVGQQHRMKCRKE